MSAGDSKVLAQQGLCTLIWEAHHEAGLGQCQPARTLGCHLRPLLFMA